MSKILGIIWVILGILWALKPAILRDRLKKKLNRRMKWTIYGFLMAFGIIMVGSVIKLPGLLPKVLGIIGIILIIKTIVLMVSKTSEKLWEWWLNQPLMVFRVQAVFLIIIGVLLILA